MIEIKNTLVAEDILAIELQEEQKGFLCGLTEELLATMQEFPHNYCAFSHGKPVAAFGLIPLTEHRALAWAILSADLKKEMVYLHKKVKEFFDSGIHGFRRVESTVDVSFSKGVRWVELLGFNREGVMRKYSKNGDDHYLYARCYG